MMSSCLEKRLPSLRIRILRALTGGEAILYNSTEVPADTD